VESAQNSIVVKKISIEKIYYRSRNMITTDYDYAIEEIRKRGIDNLTAAQVLWRVIKESFIYRFRRNENESWQYLVVMEGYGAPPNTKKWRDVTVMPPIEID
jgi:hypothetical protein